MSLLRFFLSYNRIPLILFTLFGFFFNLFYNTNILGIDENLQAVRKLDPFDRHGHLSKTWFYNTMTLINCFMGASMAVLHSLAMSSILFNAKYRVVSLLVHFLRVRNIICPLITIFCELLVFHDPKSSSQTNSLQSKLLHQFNAQLVPTIVYGLGAIMLYANYDRYLMEIRLIFDYLTLSLRCTRGLSPLEEQTYICEAINLHACRETKVLEQREKCERDMKEKLRMEKNRILKERLDRTREEEERLQDISYDNSLFPQVVSFLRTVFGLQKMAVDEDNIPPSIRTGIEKQKDELRICAAKTMCCSVQKHFKDKSSILPNCLQGISRGKINLCDLKDDKSSSGSANQSANNSGNKSINNSSSFKPSSNSTAFKKEDTSSSRIAACNLKASGNQQQSDILKRQEMEKREKERKDCEKKRAKELKARQLKCEKEAKRLQEEREKELEEKASGSIFHDLPRTDLVMNCEIKRVLDPDCQEVLRCKEVIVPPPIRSTSPRSGEKEDRSKRGSSASPVGKPFGTVGNCNQMGMAKRMQPLYQCANTIVQTTARDSSTSCARDTTSCSSSTCRSCSPTGQIQTQVRGKQMDGMNTSRGTLSPIRSTSPSTSPNQMNNFCKNEKMTSNSPSSTFSCCQNNNNSNLNNNRTSTCNTNKCQDTCDSMEAEECKLDYQQCSTNDSRFIPSQSLDYSNSNANRTTVQAIPVQVTLTESCNYNPVGGSGAVGGGGARNVSQSLNKNKNYYSNDKSSVGGPTMTAHSFSNAGAAKPLEAQNTKGESSGRSFRERSISNNSRKQQPFNRSASLGQNSNRDYYSWNPVLTSTLNDSTSAPPAHKVTFEKSGSRSSSLGDSSMRSSRSSCSKCSKCDNLHSMANSISSNQGTKNGSNSCSNPPPGRVVSMHNHNRSNSMGNCSSSKCHRCSFDNNSADVSQINRSRSCGKKGSQCNKTATMGKCDMSKNSSGQCQSKQLSSCCKLKGGSEETPAANTTAPLTKELPRPVLSSSSRSLSNNKLTETKREVFKTVTNIDDLPSGKKIRKEVDTVIEEIFQSSAVPGESKTMREVKVEKNIIQEANKTIREESHNTREEIINFEREDGQTATVKDDFESRRQRLEMMKKMDSDRNSHKRHVSEERCIYGKFKGRSNGKDVQAEAEVMRSRVDAHNMCGGLKGGSEKRGQSEVSVKCPSEEELKKPPPPARSHSMESASTKERYYGKGDFSREFTAHLESSPFGEIIQELKQKLVHLSTPEEMHKTLEQIVVLQTEALMSFVPKEGKKFPRDIVHFDPDLSYNALMRELKSVMKQNGNSQSVTKAIKDIDAINAEIERDMKRKMGAKGYCGEEGRKEKSPKPNEETGYPNHHAFAHLIRELREKIKDYEDGAQSSSRSEEEMESLEQRRQRIEVLRDELEKRRKMLGLSGKEDKMVLQDVPNMHDVKMKVNVQPTPKQVTICDPKDMPKRLPMKTIPRSTFTDETTSIDDDESIHSVPPVKELLKCSRDVCKKSKSKSKSKKVKKIKESSVTEETKAPKHIPGLPENTSGNQIAQSLAHFMDMMSKARMAKKPKISMTIKPRKTSLSQDSDVTAVDAQEEASRKRTPQPKASSFKIPKTPSNMKLNRAKSSLSGVVKQIRCGPSTEVLLKNPPPPSNLKVDQKTNEAILQYLRQRGKSIKSPTSALNMPKNQRQA